MLVSSRSLLVSRLAFAAALAVSATAAFADPDTTPVADPLARLKAGNARFVQNLSDPVALDSARRAVLAQGQHPYAIVLSCADSRVPPEHVFNAGLGDLFVIRSAGEVVDRSVLASVEYAAEHLHVSLLVVMGHESCGAVKAASEAHAGSLGPNLDYMIASIRPAVERTAKDREWLKAAILANVEQTINDALAKSQILSHLVESHKLQVVGAYYELASGRALFSQPLTTVAGEPTHSARR